MITYADFYPKSTLSIAICQFVYSPHAANYKYHWFLVKNKSLLKFYYP